MCFEFIILMTWAGAVGNKTLVKSNTNICSFGVIVLLHVIQLDIQSLWCVCWPHCSWQHKLWNLQRLPHIIEYFQSKSVQLKSSMSYFNLESSFIFPSTDRKLNGVTFIFNDALYSCSPSSTILLST